MKYRIDEFEIDTTLFQLSKGEQPIAIEPKVFDLIIYLIANRSRVVSRNELFENLWQGREVSDTSLSNHIKIARKVLQDSGERQSVIKTVRGRGYQFIAQVQQVGDHDIETVEGDNDNKDEPADNNSLIDSVNKPSSISTSANFQKSKSLAGRISRAKKLNAKSGLFLVVIFLIVCLTLVWQLLITNQQDLSKTDRLKNQSRPYILVVPFDVSGRNKEKWQPFADQVTREMILKLRQISGLKVVPTASAFTFKNDKTHKFIKEQIPEVQYVLSGFVDIEAEPKLRISGELSTLLDEKLLWNDSFLTEINNTNFFKAQSDLATAVSKSLKVAILDKEAKKIGKHHTSNIKAYENYVAGQQQLNLLTHESLKLAIELFDKAIKLDPSFEQAIVAKANAYRIIMSYYEKPSEVLPKVVDSVLQALQVNPKSAEAYSSLGLAYIFAWRWQDAWQMLNAAKQADPNIALTELGFALYYSGLGEPDKVKQSLQYANQLDPLNIELADWGHWALAMTGENKAAIDWANAKMQLHPEVGIIYSGASVSASIAGEHLRAIELAKRGIELDSGGTYPLLALAQAYGYAEQLDKVMPLLLKVEQDERYVCPYETAVTYLLLDDKDKTFDLLNQAVKYRSNCLVFTKNDPRLRPLHELSKFDALLTRIGLDGPSVSRYKR
ncbi:MAG: winged helix-turn-helix domain-containing protein [Kangiellaceae bacterium]